MQIELIAPVSVSSASLPRLGLGILAALTPPDDEVIYTDEVVRPFDLARDVKDVDLVGISVDSKTARRSYDIADAYRRRGVPVVLGGIHPTACPDEAAAHADAVVVGRHAQRGQRLRELEIEEGKAHRARLASPTGRFVTTPGPGSRGAPPGPRSATRRKMLASRPGHARDERCKSS